MTTMSLVGKVGRKRARARIAMAIVYALLVVGAITTLYPFAFMLTTGFKGPTDQNDNKLIPGYWRDDTELLAKYRDDKYAGDVNVIASNDVGRDATPNILAAYDGFLQNLPLDQWMAGFRVPANGITSRLSILWQAFLRKKYRDVSVLNSAYNDLNQAFQEVTVPFEAWERKNWTPPVGRKWEDWIEFKKSLPNEFRIPVRTEWMWQEFVRSKYRNRIESVPESVRKGARSFAELRYYGTRQPSEPTGAGLPVIQSGALVDEFRTHLPQQFRAESVESEWWRLSRTSVMPIAGSEASWVRTHNGSIKAEFTWRNYYYVLDYMALHGRALWNTALFCLLAIATQLIVNPLAAYALSRFPMKATARILLFLLATMAFPAEVAMIPSFLLLKSLGLLNTFAALVLPGAASGYTIFLLKGFFDSLPQEVFDSGQVDGAPEWVMMLRLAIPLSKPVLGYIALLAFMGAYGSFIYAFLVCQDSRMWTLMVFVYQLQVTSPKAVVMAAVTLAAVPTLVVFLACQRVIMRGIVLPGER